MSGVPGDRERLLFYFAGKGTFLNDGTPALVLDEGGEGKPVALPDLIEAFKDYYEVTVVLDAGFGLTGPRTKAIEKGVPDLATFADALSGTRVSLVFASGPGDDSLVEDADGRGIFTTILLGGLRGSADTDKDGALSKEEISNHLITEVKKSATVLAKKCAPFLQLHEGSWLPTEVKPVVRKRPAKRKKKGEEKAGPKKMDGEDQEKPPAGGGEEKIPAEEDADESDEKSPGKEGAGEDEEE
jgi:hypothetical protein